VGNFFPRREERPNAKAISAADEMAHSHAYYLKIKN